MKYTTELLTKANHIVRLILTAEMARSFLVPFSRFHEQAHFQTSCVA
jgi:hypothetical protein